MFKAICSKAAVLAEVVVNDPPEISVKVELSALSSR
jgi:hypothetical protein